ncbi:hypothetical protein K431DRAFT_109399 [Polychaeton citri CBS 116435]|uniref:Uncharacterized protein n=1 Tax=Polychaeton citri CBS 116435 TaxID=1314669 RepID=A0A9P4Q4M8_9PEZI|nr:hypothetical protein K431DRAFT_109399 [Polychaeton citri CBS 116435]
MLRPRRHTAQRRCLTRIGKVTCHGTLRLGSRQQADATAELDSGLVRQDCLIVGPNWVMAQIHSHSHSPPSPSSSPCCCLLVSQLETRQGEQVDLCEIWLSWLSLISLLLSHVLHVLSFLVPSAAAATAAAISLPLPLSLSLFPIPPSPFSHLTSFPFPFSGTSLHPPSPFFTVPPFKPSNLLDSSSIY